MKTATLIALVVFSASACAVEETPSTSSESAAASNPPSVLGTDATVSEDWVIGKMVNDDLWPTNQGITSTQVLIRKGPARPDGSASKTFVAFVVWNHSTVGHVYWVNIGNQGADFHNVWDSAVAQHTNAYPDHNGGGTGGPDAGTPPIPHPQVFGWALQFSSTYLQNAKDAAAAIDNANAAFNAYSE